MTKPKLTAVDLAAIRVFRLQSVGFKTAGRQQSLERRLVAWLTAFYPDELAELSHDERSTACGFLAAMIETGDA